MKRLRPVAIILFITILTLLLVTVLPIRGEEKIYDTVVRLHVLANSDSDEDQALKLKVRDKVLSAVAPIVKDCKTQTEAENAIRQEMTSIEAAAQVEVLENGYPYDVSVKLVHEYYPEKNYESCAFPEGEYLSLQVLIGEAMGKNWWCCMFPPLCLSVCEKTTKKDNEDAFVSVGLTKDQYKIITETDNVKYKARFKILETVQKYL